MAHKRIFETRKINTSVHCFLFSTKMAVCLSFRCICVVYTVPCEKAGLQYTVLLLSTSHCALIGHNFPRANVSFAVRRSYTRSSRNSNNYSIFICYIQIRRSVFKYYTSKKMFNLTFEYWEHFSHFVWFVATFHIMWILGVSWMLL